MKKVLMMLCGAVNKPQVFQKMKMTWEIVGMQSIGSNHLKKIGMNPYNLSPEARTIIAVVLILVLTFFVCYVAKKYSEYIEKWRKNID